MAYTHMQGQWIIGYEDKTGNKQTERQTDGGALRLPAGG